ncbi:cytochrome C assembly family protein [Staphylococcus durrellii]|uniref:cytochrome C assembly family protein n=1 Tax=Staphylococcus durrellii TaxID=2781773 RepID=UPI00189F7DC4|nr:cytochrome c biogenesis protein [Staphylococcus durrellii]MBF7016901.1 cytochrome c biogenesis protein CcsA [Staphylococcus durrellii]
MQDGLFIRFHEIILFIYFVSISCYFYDFFRKNFKIRRLGFISLGIVWVLQTISLSLFINQTRSVPLSNIFDILFIITWLIISISIVISVIKPIDFSIFLLNLVGFVLIALNTFQPMNYFEKGQQVTVINELLIVHISFATMSYALFTLAFVNCILYLIQYNNLKQKRFTQKYFRLGSVATLEQIVFYSSLVGFILLILSLILGAQWGMNTIGITTLVDKKVIFSFIIAILYAVYILFRVKQYQTKHKLIYFNIILFCLCMINLLFGSSISSFH